MNFLLIALLTLPAFSQGLIQVPDDEVVADDVSSGGSKSLLDFPFADRTAPRSDNPEDYVQWMSDRFLNNKKQVLGNTARNLSLRTKVQCLPIPGAFGFEEVSESEFRVNCYAGTRKELTHVLDFHLSINYVPSNCASQQAMRDFFTIPNNRNPEAATNFLRQTRISCSMTAAPVNPATPIVSSVAVSQRHVEKVLENRDDLRVYVSGTRTKKSGSGSTGKYTNPLKKSGSRIAN